MNILVTGGTGFVGKNLQNIVKNSTKFNYIFTSSRECDLRDKLATYNLFEKYNPKYIIHLAANMGGLYKNLRERTSMFTDNVRINENILEACNIYNVQRGIFCLSSCIFPTNPSKYPMNESMLHESEPHNSNEGFAYSKRMLEMQCRNYNKKYNREYICIISVNLYGPYDNFSIGEDSRVLPSIIHKIYIAKKNKKDFTLFGSGRALRQFLYVEDFVNIILMVLFKYNSTKSIIISNDEVSIKNLVNIISKIYNFSGKIRNDLDKADGCLKKTVDNSYFLSLFPNFKFTPLEDGIKNTITWFDHSYFL